MSSTNNKQKYINAASHNLLFTFINSDILLNEFLWRADMRTGILKQQLETVLHFNKYNILIETTSLLSGIYINAYLNGAKIWHISFHLQNKQNQSPPGALHIINNTQTIYACQLFNITIYPSSNCQLHLLNLKRSLLFPDTLQSFCTQHDNSLNIVIDILKQYFTHLPNNYSLYNNLTYKNKPHKFLMPIIRTRPCIQRTPLTAYLTGGKYKHTRRTIRRDEKRE